MKPRLAAVPALLLLGASLGFAQAPGEAIYKAKCQSCHGAKGMADTPAGKAIKVKPVTDPSVKNMSEAEMIAATEKGMGKMRAYKDSLSATQVKEAVTYFRSFLK